MENDIKILFMSDLHLGMKIDDVHIPDYARVNTFKRIIAIAREHDLLLIGGDLIDHTEIGGDIIDLIKAEFRNLRKAGTEIIYTPGIGELNERGTIPPFLLDFTVSCLFSNVINSIPYLYIKDGQKLYIYGVPATAGYDITKIRKVSEDGFHIGLFHVDVDFERDASEALVYRIQKHDIRSLGLDFYAFGFNHNFRMFKIMERIVGVCPGSTESTSFNDAGDRYAISIIIRENKLFQIKRLTVNTMKLYRNSIDCSDLITMGPIKELLENNRSKKIIQKLILSGSRNFVLRHEELKKYSGEFFRLDIVDESLPTLDSLVEEFQYENSIRGEFFKILKDQIDQNRIPHDIDSADLSQALDRITRGGFGNLEDWLCNL